VLSINLLKMMKMLMMTAESHYWNILFYIDFVICCKYRIFTERWKRCICRCSL